MTELYVPQIVDFPAHFGGETAPALGWWRTSDGDVFVVCPRCSVVLDLRRKTIAEDGRVKIGHADCAFYQCLILEGWEAV